MGDYLVKALAFNGQVRAYAIRSTETVAEAQRRHDTWPTASAALGRTITASAMMGAMLKGNEKITVKVEGNGPIGAIIVDADSHGKVRGYLKHPHVHFDLNEHGKLDVSKAVGKEGFLTVIKDLGLKEHFTGQVPLVSGELGEDFTYYFASSEQTPSSVGVGVIVDTDNSILASGGFIIQLMPNTEDAVIDQIEKRLGVMSPISTLVKNGLTPEEILDAVLGEGNSKILDTLPVSYECHCSLERVQNAIIGIGQEEIKNMIEEDGKAEVQCHFCNENYLLTKDDLIALLDKVDD